MRNFEHLDAPDVRTAVELLREPHTQAIAGGTDLLTEMKERLRTPERLVNLKTIRGLNEIREDSDGLHIGALVTLDGLERHPLVRQRFSIIAEAAAVAATPQLRNAGTVGGNLCQQVRCWYYRHPDLTCWLKGGDTCYAREGINRRHAIFATVGRSECIAVHPSDLAPALMALDAQVRLVGPEVEGELPLEEIYRLPDEIRRERTHLGPADLITEIIVPEPSPTSRGAYVKAMERATWSFALVSVATQIDFDGDRVKDVRIVLGGVAGIPWRAKGAEEALRGQRMTEERAERAGEAAVTNAEPFEHNAYKVPLAKNLVKRGLLELVTVNRSIRRPDADDSRRDPG